MRSEEGYNASESGHCVQLQSLIQWRKKLLAENLNDFIWFSDELAQENIPQKLLY